MYTQMYVYIYIYGYGVVLGLWFFPIYIYICDCWNWSWSANDANDVRMWFKRFKSVSSHSEKRRSHGETAMNCLAWTGVDAGNC